jgi:hypothetical protein
VHNRTSWIVGAVAIAAVVWLGLVIHHKNGTIDAFSREVRSTKADISRARAETRSIVSKFNSFKAHVAQLATSDMVSNVNDAAGIGGAVAQGCGPGYTRPSCDWWYESASPQGPPLARAWGAQALAQFSLGSSVQDYGDGLVRRALEGT